ncbi:unnamed protein product [Adineta steineri]|uniref:Uncharacterized protein n=1 Tax=Adineta steineri TaxID=433720 RepID=A0A818FYB5_9BILA|nr:unnamed protein product [Adineta steineri]CAF0883485.1 unnamed protein product [Adineta steineri]CAF0946439.1 unnamed protein product [Adineta steineri]CAF3482763.1 unnamed protein product [Adineta steineri]CAF3505873.1 unnamed protein product [Adineta steineri]
MSNIVPLSDSPPSPSDIPPPSNPTICENEVECSKPALVTCHHCPKRLCLKHVLEHNEINIVRTYSLSDEINCLTHLLSKLDCQKSVENARKHLDTWKENILTDIENTYKHYSKEIDDLQNELNQRVDIFKDSQKSKMSSLQTQLAALQKVGEISQNQLLPIERDLSHLRQCLESVRCEICIETTNVSCNDLINAYNIFSYNRILPNNTLMQSYRTIPVENNKKFVSSQQNGTILWLDNRRQLHYIDQKFHDHILTLPSTMCNPPTASSALLPYHQTGVKDVDVVDLKWCSKTEAFLILFQRHLYSFDPKTHKFTQIPITRHKDYPFRCLSFLNDSSLYISYCVFGICIELWKYPTSNVNLAVKRWDRLANDKTEWVSHMDANINSNIGLLIRTASSVHTRFEIRDETLNLLKQIQLNDDFVDSFYPFRSHQWYVKSSSGKYYIYSTETNTYEPSSFEFQFGLQEFGINSMIIGSGQNELTLCDV